MRAIAIIITLIIAACGKVLGIIHRGFFQWPLKNQTSPENLYSYAVLAMEIWGNKDRK